jgi:peptide/nickel transport system substrate-binding protein
VRQALTHALDRQKIVERIRLGHARPIHSTYAPASWAYTDDVPKFNYDVEKAKRLLDETGWRTPAGNSSGTRVKEGKPLKMRIFYNAGNKEREQIATIAQQYFKAVGVETEVISEEWNAYLNRVNSTKDLEMYVLGWNAGIDPWSFSNSIWKSDGTQNSTGYNNPKVDALVPQGAYVPGCKQEDRKKAYVEIQKLIAADQPYIFLWENEALSGLHNRIVPNKLTRLGYGYWPWEWYSKTGQ